MTKSKIFIGMLTFIINGCWANECTGRPYQCNNYCSDIDDNTQKCVNDCENVNQRCEQAN